MGMMVFAATASRPDTGPGAGPGAPERLPLPERLEDPLRDALRDGLTYLPADWQPWLKLLALVAVLACVAFALRVVLQGALLFLQRRLVKAHSPTWLHILLDTRVLRRAARVLSPLVVQVGLANSPYRNGAITGVLLSLLTAWLVLCIARVLLAVLDAVLLHEAESSRNQPRQHLALKSYVQLAKLLLMLGCVVIIVAELINRSPLLLLSGLGALSAILMLVFKDTILSFTAGVQLTSNDMLRVGDWIEMPQVGADGAVRDMALHAVTVQNWDNTLTTIPTWRLVSESYRNWRGMSESGARRIKRSLLLDATSVHFLRPQEWQRLQRIALLRDYLREKRQALDATNDLRHHELPPDLADAPVNQRRLTNLGTFRAYVSSYLAQQPDLRHDMTELVSILNPTAQGVPVQIYCFTATTDWKQYEAILGNLFDHLLAVLPEFGLRVFQQPSGYDMRLLVPPDRLQADDGPPDATPDAAAGSAAWPGGPPA